MASRSPVTSRSTMRNRLPCRSPGRSFFRLAALAQHLEFRVLKQGQVGRLALGQMDAEPLARDGVAVLQAGIAHVPVLHAGGRGQLLGDEGGVGTVLFDVQPDVFALAAGQLQRQFGHDEILVEEFQGGAGAAGRIGVGPQRQGRVSRVGHGQAVGGRGRGQSRNGILSSCRREDLAESCGPASSIIASMTRVLAFLLAFALLLQASWAVAATYCGHETSHQAALHFGHHTHVHKTAPGKSLLDGKIADDTDCLSCHAAHPALASAPFSCVDADIPKAANFDQPRISASAPPDEPDRPQWLRLA